VNEARTPQITLSPSVQTAIGRHTSQPTESRSSVILWRLLVAVNRKSQTREFESGCCPSRTEETRLRRRSLAADQGYYAASVAGVRTLAFAWAECNRNWLSSAPPICERRSPDIIRRRAAVGAKHVTRPCEWRSHPASASLSPCQTISTIATSSPGPGIRPTCCAASRAASG
jgi:hypothetical protein